MTARLQQVLVVVLATPGMVLGYIAGGLVAWGRLLQAGFQTGYRHWIKAQVKND